MKKRILFICLGNICRSPAAEGVMRTLVHRAGRDAEFEIDSAGIGGWHVGNCPTAGCADTVPSADIPLIHVPDSSPKMISRISIIFL